MKKPELYSLTG